MKLTYNPQTNQIESKYELVVDEKATLQGATINYTVVKYVQAGLIKDKHAF